MLHTYTITTTAHNHHHHIQPPQSCSTTTTTYNHHHHIQPPHATTTTTYNHHNHVQPPPQSTRSEPARAHRSALCSKQCNLHKGTPCTSTRPSASYLLAAADTSCHVVDEDELIFSMYVAVSITTSFSCVQNVLHTADKGL